MQIKRCGAKARKHRTTPCQRYPAVGGNGRCKLHNGLKKSIHGRCTYRAKKERVLERDFLANMVAIEKERREGDKEK